jgi:hypothetical protein
MTPGSCYRKQLDLFSWRRNPPYRNRTLVEVLEDIKPVEFEDTDKKDNRPMEKVERGVA